MTSRILAVLLTVAIALLVLDLAARSAAPAAAQVRPPLQPAMERHLVGVSIGVVTYFSPKDGKYYSLHAVVRGWSDGTVEWFNTDRNLYTGGWHEVE